MRTRSARTTRRSSTSPAASTAGTSTFTTSSSPRSSPCGVAFTRGRMGCSITREAVASISARSEAASGGLGPGGVGPLGGEADQLGVVDQAPHRAGAVVAPEVGVVDEIEVGVERVVDDREATTVRGG